MTGIYAATVERITALDFTAHDDALAELEAERLRVEAGIADAQRQQRELRDRQDAVEKRGRDPRAAASAFLDGDAMVDDANMLADVLSDLHLAERGLKIRLGEIETEKTEVGKARLADTSAAFTPAMERLQSMAETALLTLQQIYADARVAYLSTRSGAAAQLNQELERILAAAVHSRVLPLPMTIECSPELVTALSTPPLAAHPAMPTTVAMPSRA